MTMKVTYRARLLAEDLNAGLINDETRKLRIVINYIYAVYYCSEEEIEFGPFLDKMDAPEFETRMLSWYREDLKKTIGENKKKEELQSQ